MFLMKFLLNIAIREYPVWKKWETDYIVKIFYFPSSRVDTIFCRQVSFFSRQYVPLYGQIDHRRRQNAAKHFRVSSKAACPHYRRISDVRAKWFMKDFLPELETISTGATAISVTVIWSNQLHVIICN